MASADNHAVQELRCHVLNQFVRLTGSTCSPGGKLDAKSIKCSHHEHCVSSRSSIERIKNCPIYRF